MNLTKQIIFSVNLFPLLESWKLENVLLGIEEVIECKTPWSLNPNIIDVGLNNASINTHTQMMSALCSNSGGCLSDFCLTKFCHSI